jgi:DNA polymerase-1
MPSAAPNNTPAKRLVLVDGSSFLFRAYHALPPLTNSKGEPTGAVYGVVNMLKRLLKDYPSTNIAVVFDASGRSFRNDLYTDYKAHRPPTPPDLASQFEPLCGIVRALGLPVLAVDNVEADDVIGTLAVQARQQGLPTLVATNDKDLAQLVDDSTLLVNTMDGTVMDEAGVKAKFGVPPERMVDYLTLVGDAVDNVPGVAKVGPKTAAKWLQEYGSLDALAERAGEVPGKIGENLREFLPRLPLTRELVTVKCDVEFPETIDNLVPQDQDKSALRDWFSRLEFKTWLKELDSANADAQAKAEPQPDPPASSPTLSKDGYETVLTQEAFDNWLARLKAAPLFAFDTETTSLDAISAEVVGVSFAVTPDEAAYVPIGHQYLGVPEQLDGKAVLKTLRPLLEDPKRPKLGHNLKYDMSVLVNHEIAMRGIAYDTMLESYVLDSVGSRHDMDTLADKYLNYKTIHYEDVAGKGAQQLSFSAVPLEQAGPYAAEDADVTLKLHHALFPRLKQEPGLLSLFETIEMPLVPVLSRMERHGVLIDRKMLNTQSMELAERIAEIEQQAHDLAGQPFNIGSPKQIQAILFEQMGLPVKSRTPKGQPSTGEDVLAELALDYPLPKLILEHRGLSKLRSTYTEKLPQQIHPKTGRVHTSYHQAVAATGRLSSADPNLQNIPARTAEGRRIRQAFVAPPGYRLLAADYSQIELRIMAHLSGDERLLEAFAQGEDIHKATAGEVFGVAPEQVNPEQRRAAKAINFGLIYGMSAFGLARQLGIERGAAQEYVDRYFARYPGVKAFMDQTRASARELGYVETVFKRRLYLPEINARNNQRRQYAERTAINAPMQGTAADIIKRAMIAVDQCIIDNKQPVKLIMQVHDELVLEAPEDKAEQIGKQVCKLMEQAADLRVPLVVDLGMGANWDEAHGA